MCITGLLVVPIGSRSRVFEEAGQQGDRSSDVLPVSHLVDGVDIARGDRHRDRLRATSRALALAELRVPSATAWPILPSVETPRCSGFKRRNVLFDVILTHDLLQHGNRALTTLSLR